MANAVPLLPRPARPPRPAHGGPRSAPLLGVMLVGLSVLIGRFHLQRSRASPSSPQLADASLGHNWAFYVVQFATVVLLALAANTSFGGLPVLMSLLARDNYLPHVFGLKADRQVHRHGVLALAAVSALLLVFSGGDVNTLVPLFAIGVFVGFTICQVGMVRHWRRERSAGRRGKALLNGFGALLTGVSAVVVTATKFEEGAWLIVVALPLMVLVFEAVHRAYGRIGERLELGRVPEAPRRCHSVVVVPVSTLSRLTSKALTAAVSLGDEVVAVTVAQPDAEGRRATESLRRDWELWKPGVGLVELPAPTRALGRPIAEYVRELADRHPDNRVTVLIPEVEPAHVWQRLLQNQRGAVVAHAVRRDTDAVICRLRFRLSGDAGGPRTPLITSTLPVRTASTPPRSGRGFAYQGSPSRCHRATASSGCSGTGTDHSRPPAASRRPKSHSPAAVQGKDVLNEPSGPVSTGTSTICPSAAAARSVSEPAGRPARAQRPVTARVAGPACGSQAAPSTRSRPSTGWRSSPTSRVRPSATGSVATVPSSATTQRSSPSGASSRASFSIPPAVTARWTSHTPSGTPARGTRPVKRPSPSSVTGNRSSVPVTCPRRTTSVDPPPGMRCTRASPARASPDPSSAASDRRWRTPSSAVTS
ncbi:hypothetical protein GCM10020221_18520 [Streptomyces thioluteus]|uniref:Amino acid permease n=1 Tax=Streptomyces thioluteus TaxID=66431 RepID=A0ABN3WRA2_STRTU